MDSKTINREAGDKSKGSRLQRLRAIKFLLSKVNDTDIIAVCAATEFLDDVYQEIVKTDGTIVIVSEEDKNYAPNVSFSFHSDEVKNTLVGFIDCWIYRDYSKNLHFCFYTNAKIGSEKTIKANKEKRPKKSILKQLMGHDYKDPLLLPYVKYVIIKDYQKQYEAEVHKGMGYLTTLESWSDLRWTNFLDKIDWQFEKEDDKKLEVSLLDSIKKCNPYSVNIEGKEKLILTALEHRFERNQESKDYYTRVVTTTEVKNTFLEVGNDVYRNCDPVYELWGLLPKPTDKRNLSGKIKDVCKTYSEKELGRKARKVCEAKLELGRLDYKDRGAYQYRAFTGSEEKLMSLLRVQGSAEISESDIDNWVEEMVLNSSLILQERSKDYTYAFTNKETLRNVILELFDSCYLAFDEGE